MPSEGQGAEWYLDLRWQASPTARDVAQQLARFRGHDSEVVMPWRTLADAVGKRDRANRTRAYVESGVDVLKRHGGWRSRPWAAVAVLKRQGDSCRGSVASVPPGSTASAWRSSWTRLRD